jgi:hypothetical protein
MLKWLKRIYDDVLVYLFTAGGVFLNGILPWLLAVQRGEAQEFPEVKLARLVTSGVLAGVVMLLEAKSNGHGDGKKMPIPLTRRLVLGFSLGYMLTGLMG